MSENPEERTKDSKKVSESNIEQAEPLDKQDPTEPVEVGQGLSRRGETKGTEGASGL